MHDTAKDFQTLTLRYRDLHPTPRSSGRSTANSRPRSTTTGELVTCTRLERRGAHRSRSRHTESRQIFKPRWDVSTSTRSQQRATNTIWFLFATHSNNILHWNCRTNLPVCKAERSRRDNIHTDKRRRNSGIHWTFYVHEHTCFAKSETLLVGEISILCFLRHKDDTKEKVWKAIKVYLHLNDRTKAIDKGRQGYDPLYKVRPIISMTQQTFAEHYRPGPNLTVDEAMIACKCRCGFIQYMPAKPTRWGIKVWACCDASSYYMAQYR